MLNAKEHCDIARMITDLFIAAVLLDYWSSVFICGVDGRR